MPSISSACLRRPGKVRGTAGSTLHCRCCTARHLSNTLMLLLQLQAVQKSHAHHASVPLQPHEHANPKPSKHNTQAPNTSETASTHNELLTWRLPWLWRAS
jgi:hypothetical protein